MKRFITTVVVLALIGGGIYALLPYLPEASDGNKSDVRTNTARLRDLETVVSATGEVLPRMSSIVKSEISGRIIRLHVREGEAVTRGQLLIELDRTSLETREREAQRNLEADQLRMEKAERNFKRLEELYSKQFVGERDFLDAQTDFHLTRLNLEIAQARLEDAQEDLSKTSITAPHDGIVTLIPVVDGQVISGATSVSNGTDLLTISQLKELYMEANINEVDVEQLKRGHEARLTFDAIPNFSVPGAIDVIAPSARRDGNIRVFPIEVIFEVTDARVRPGISATVDIPISRVENVVSVLLSAVFRRDGETFVYLRNGNSWEQRSVETGINNMQHVEILSGLQDGDVVALSRPAEFRNAND